MIERYTYHVTGTAAGGQTWATTGTIEIPLGDFAYASAFAVRESFFKLARSDAVYGSPGLGCEGPYKVTKLVLEKEPTLT